MSADLGPTFPTGPSVWEGGGGWATGFQLKGAPDPVARELYFQTEYCMNIIQIPHSRTL